MSQSQDLMQWLRGKSTPWLEAFEFVRHRSRHYNAVFRQPESGKAVLYDLAKFCRANKTTWNDDPHKRDVLIGRREVWLRIQEHLNLSPEELTDLYIGPNNKDTPK